MRILLLTVDFPPAMGGIQNQLANLAEGLAAGHDVCVVAPHRDGDQPWDAKRAHVVARVPRLRLWPLVMAAFLCAAASKAILRRPNVVVCGHVLLGPVCWIIARV